ncbi:MAG: ThiF family adenylyltransferase, partial [Spirochaetes bacterium]|nr:ThiF family adenylyltransferase [Spirochaetota bacterium]
MSGLSDRERERYTRQLVLPSWGEESQLRLKAATVFVAGAGGLGSAVVLYLAAAGVGCIRVCDRDTVELSNLNRQILHAERGMGMRKALSAQKAVTRLNS